MTVRGAENGKANFRRESLKRKYRFEDPSIREYIILK